MSIATIGAFIIGEYPEGVKVIVFILGLIGLATMRKAVFADLNVALLAILNAVRLQRLRWD